jgi:hypothetical protein
MGNTSTKLCSRAPASRHQPSRAVDDGCRTTNGVAFRLACAAAGDGRIQSSDGAYREQHRARQHETLSPAGHTRQRARPGAGLTGVCGSSAATSDNGGLRWSAVVGDGGGGGGGRSGPASSFQHPASRTQRSRRGSSGSILRAGGVLGKERRSSLGAGCWVLGSARWAAARQQRARTCGSQSLPTAPWGRRGRQKRVSEPGLPAGRYSAGKVGAAVCCRPCLVRNRAGGLGGRIRRATQQKRCTKTPVRAAASRSQGPSRTLRARPAQ